MKIRGVDFIMYPVSDMARAVEFYRDLLGVRQEVASPDWVEFDCGNVTLALMKSEDPGARRVGRLALAVEDLDAAYAELKARGIAGLKEPMDFGVCRAIELSDPDGNPLLLHRRADGTFGPGQTCPERSSPGSSCR